MKKLLIATIVTVLCIANVKSQNIKQATIKSKYENVFYRESSKKEAKFLVEKILFSSNYKSKDRVHIYQVSIYGIVNGAKKRLHHNVQSTEELTYYKNVFSSRYKKIQLYFGKNKIAGKTYFNTSINVEY